jgi:AraC family transcriptional regulator of adaptative response/methylated-DNA-[protein]-cysteine methyltransferase
MDKTPSGGGAGPDRRSLGWSPDAPPGSAPRSEESNGFAVWWRIGEEVEFDSNGRSVMLTEKLENALIDPELRKGQLIMQSTLNAAVPKSGNGSDCERWAAVVNRDARADGQFVYAVRTTGVYCRPSCASRAALRANVVFYASCEAAEQGGFRACKRCQPDQGSLAERRAERIAQACRLVDTASEMPTPTELANAVGLSRYHFHRVFKAVTGVTPKAFIAAARAQRVRAGLTSAPSVTSAIYDAGFNSNGRFYATSSALLGMTPTSYRAGGLNTVIRFAVGQCSLGAILVGATDKGVCAILIDDDPERLVRQLQDQFPRALLIGADHSFEKQVAKVVGLVEAPALGLDLPLDLQGTTIQQRVWQALRAIPAGTSVSYSAVARSIGQPHAARAVALACAANPLAVAIPCHRVVRQDGALSGYRWGIARKRALLDRESAP